MKKTWLLVISFVSLIILTGCGNSKEETITAVGSSAVQPLTEAAGEKYSELNKDSYINVQGGGTGTGLSQIQSGAVDIGNSDLFAEQKKGIDADKLVGYQICVVGIVPIVNKELNVDNLSLSQLRKIFSGEITNWKEVGGPDLAITVVNRANGSGTRSVFENSVMNNIETKSSQEQDSSGMVRQIISNTPGSISYVALPYLNSDAKALTIDHKAATPKNIINNDWKIWAYEHMYTQKNANKLTKDFVKYILSDEVQNDIVKKMKYIPMKDMKYQKDINGHVTPIKR
ncbi:phosphate ABC transporter substrate-binding protein [Companilactobacillus sp. RD055328]|uniref:phosphate ABC transporter substrate-binding protein n=1 Tax=Companilactobacillus sp. RD055328 TaxID=2916634 RepID=UPI001FC8C073|nr:phosphate ABC transporter substrate-binding protein [Companilactobacillus sp. RD055328]GKQ43054.1 phosphate ABC transporter substrate-binding protein [Companilactobacillus sp. RD055328]